MPGRLVPSAPATQTWASTRRTPSVNTTQGAAVVDGAGDLGAHWSPGTSTSTSTWASLAASCSSVPIAEPYSGAHASTANCIAYPSTFSTTDVVGVLDTSKRTGTRSARSRTWVTTPTM